MAWPINARYQSFISATTRITAAFLNDIQDKIFGVIGGGKTVTRVTADGTGDAAAFTEAGGGTPYLAASFGGSGFAPMLDLHDTTAGAAQMRIYRSNAGFCAWISNAYYNIPTSKWVQEDVAKNSYGLAIDPSATPPISILKKAAGSAAWTTWDAGSINALDFTASGDLIGVAAKAKRFFSTGTALASGDFALDGAGKWGSTATASAVTGSDMAGTVTISSAGVGQAANPTLALTFKDGTFTTTPTVIWSMKGGTGVAAGPYGVEWTVTATTTTVQMFGTPAAGSTYIFSWMVIGN